MLLTAPLLKIYLECDRDTVYERHSVSIYR